MDNEKHKPSTSLNQALDSYAEWLHRHFALGIDVTDDRESGAQLLRVIAEIRRHSCPGASQLMTNLLLDHTKLSTMLFERQLKLVRGEATAPLLQSQECASLMERQSATIRAMRTACTVNRAFCIHTEASKDTPQKITIRPAAAADPGQLRPIG